MLSCYFSHGLDLKVHKEYWTIARTWLITSLSVVAGKSSNNWMQAFMQAFLQSLHKNNWITKHHPWNIPNTAMDFPFLFGR